MNEELQGELAHAEEVVEELENTREALSRLSVEHSTLQTEFKSLQQCCDIAESARQAALQREHSLQAKMAATDFETAAAQRDIATVRKVRAVVCCTTTCVWRVD